MISYASIIIIIFTSVTPFEKSTDLHYNAQLHQCHHRYLCSAGYSGATQHFSMRCRNQYQDRR